MFLTHITIPQDKLEKSEQELWEESQTAKASHKSKKKKDGNEYDLVFEDVIEFVNTEKKKAKNKKGEGERALTSKTKKNVTYFVSNSIKQKSKDQEKLKNF